MVALKQLLAGSRSVIFVAACVTTLMPGGCKRDVTNDSAYGFSAVVGTWKTKVPITLVDVTQHSYTSASGLYLGVDIRPAAELNSPNVRLTTLPIGTEIRIEHLMADNSAEAGSIYWVTGSLTSGPYAGKPLTIDSHLFAPNAYLRNYFSATPSPSHLPSTWSVNPDELGK